MIIHVTPAERRTTFPCKHCGCATTIITARDERVVSDLCETCEERAVRRALQLK